MFSQCPHCQPYSKYFHIIDKLAGYSRSLYRWMFGYDPEKGRRHRRFVNRVWVWLLLTLRSVGIVSFVRDPDRSRLYNRGLVFFDAAKRKDISVRAVTIFGVYVHEYVYRNSGKLQAFHKLPDLPPQAAGCIDDKVWTKKQLQDNDLPTPTGRSFWCKKTGVEYGQELGYPLVVKPARGSLSKHVTTNITTQGELAEAITIAHKIGPEYIIEKHLDGRLFRATVIDRQHVFVCEKKRAHVTGDGKRTIEQLIDEKNAHLERGETEQKNTTLHKIDKQSACQYLRDGEYDLHTVPDEKEVVILSATNTLAAGCDVIEYSEGIHPENQKILKEAARVLDAGLIGFDLICADISKSWQDQDFGIIEANTKPYVDMHAFPSTGNPQPVAETVWEAIQAKQ